MYLSATALVIVLRLVAAAPRYQTHESNMPLKVNFDNPFDECDLGYDCGKAYSYEPDSDISGRSMPMVTKAIYLGSKAYNHGSSETLIRVALATCDNEDDCRKEEVYVPDPVGPAFCSPDWYPLLLKTAPQSIKAHIHESEGLENCIGKSFIPVDVPSTPQSSFKISTQSLATMSEKIPGWIFFSEKIVQGRIHGNTFWNIKGQLDEKFPYDDFLFDPLVFSLNHPQDYDGEFTGQIGRGEIILKWEKSGATITGRSGIGDFTIKGKTYVDYSP